ncbi:MAG: uroporphyrinogen-III synthase [Curvibacter sp.]|nr:uroporphyrinogen-III synthase [Curvibacter sp.]
MAPPCVLVTRPEPDASTWARQLREQGWNAQALPLIHIDAPRHPQPAPPGPWRAWMFVSPNAVQHFHARAAHQIPMPDRAWAPGPGTARALIAAGWDASRVDTPPPDAGQFDSEHLWAQVHSQVQAGDRVLIVRGLDAPTDDAQPLPAEAAQRGSGREWLAARLHEAGAQAVPFVVYERHAPTADATLLQRARTAAADGSLWLFSSSEAIRNLQACLPDVSWQAATALVTHPRIGAAATAAGFGRVLDSRPTLEAVIASIESLP